MGYDESWYASPFRHFIRQFNNDSESPWDRFLASGVLSIAEACAYHDLKLELVSQARLYAPTTHELVQLRLENRPVYLTMHRLMDRRVGVSKVFLRIELERHGTRLRLTKHGSLVYDHEPDWVDSSQTWELAFSDLSNREIIQEMTRLMAQVVITCGFWHTTEMGGLMTNCESCQYQFSCMVSPKYSIELGSRV